jgi:hypothetical protein
MVAAAYEEEIDAPMGKKSLYLIYTKLSQIRVNVLLYLGQ